MSVELERQLAAYGEHLEMLAVSAAPDTETLTPAAGSRTLWRGIAVAAAAAAVVFLAIGSIALLSPLSEEQIAPVTGTRVPGPPSAERSASGLLINRLQDLALAPDGAVWAATAGGVIRWETGVSIPVVYGEEDGLPAAHVDQIVVADNGTVWAAGNDWIAYYDQTWRSVEAVTNLEEMETDFQDVIAADPTGGVWVLGWDGEGNEAIFRVDSEGAEMIIPLPEGHVGWGSSVDIAVDSAGRFWMVDIFDPHEVFVYDGGTWREFATTEPLFGDTSHYIVSNIEIAPDGTVWISTMRDSDPEPVGTPAPGVAASDGGAWTTYTTADGLASDAGTVVISQDGTVWVVHGDAVSRRDGDTWTVYDVTSSPRGAVGGPDGTLWLDTNNGIVHFEAGTTTRLVVPGEMTPVPPPFSLEPVASATSRIDAGSFGEVSWQKLDVPTGHSLTGGIHTAHGFAAIGGGAPIRTSVNGVNWVTSDPPLEARHLVASGDDLYALGGVAVRLAWTGTTWGVVDELSIPDPGPEIPSEPGYLDFAERMAFGDGVTVMTARSRVFFSTDEHTFVPALRGPDPEILKGSDEPDLGNTGYAGGCDPSWYGGWDGEGSIGPVFATGSGFVAFTSGHPNDWNDFGLCRPVIWMSNDGSIWDLVSSESPFGSSAYVHGMAERDGRFVAVGGRGEDQGVLWGSNDGIAWNEIPSERISGSITTPPWAIATGDAGWVALYGDAGTEGGVRAMYSLDGLEWVVTADALPDLWWAWGAPDVAVGTDRILVTYYGGVAFIGEITR